MKLFFEKWGVDYKITSYTSGECTGMRGAIYRPDIHTSKVSANDYDGIVLIGGSGIDEYKIADFRPILDLMTLFNERKKYIISMDNATRVPARANIIRDKPIAVQDKETLRLVNLFRGVPSDKEYEIAGNLITVKDSSALEDTMVTILENVGVS